MSAIQPATVSRRQQLYAALRDFAAEVYHPGHVWRILRQLGWTPQRPTGRALERDEDAVRNWKKHRWPALSRLDGLSLTP